MTTPASANSSSSVAWREGTGLPSASLCVGDTVLEKPSPPAAIDSRSSSCIAAISAPVAWLPTARAPITWRRNAECPTMKPALIASLPSSASRYSPKLRQFHGTPSRRLSSGMPSTRASMRIRYSLSSGLPLSGAMLKPQLPAITVVTP